MFINSFGCASRDRRPSFLISSRGRPRVFPGNISVVMDLHFLQKKIRLDLAELQMGDVVVIYTTRGALPRKSSPVVVHGSVTFVCCYVFFCWSKIHRLSLLGNSYGISYTSGNSKHRVRCYTTMLYSKINDHSGCFMADAY